MPTIVPSAIAPEFFDGVLGDGGALGFVGDGGGLLDGDGEDGQRPRCADAKEDYGERVTSMKVKPLRQAQWRGPLCGMGQPLSAEEREKTPS